MLPKLSFSTVYSALEDESSKDTSRVTDISFGTTLSELLEEIRDDTWSFEQCDVDHNKEASDPNKDIRDASDEGVRSESEHISRLDSFGFPVENDLLASQSQTNAWPELEEKSISSGINGNISIKANSQNYTTSTCGTSFSCESTRHGKDASFLESVGTMSLDAFGFQLPPPLRDSPSKSVRSAPIQDANFRQELESPPLTSMPSVKSTPDLTSFKFNNHVHLELKAVTESPTLDSEPATDDDFEPDPELIATGDDVDKVVDLVLEETDANTKGPEKPHLSASVNDHSFEAAESSIGIDDDSVRLNDFEAHEDSIEVHEDSFEIPAIPRRHGVPRKTPEVPPQMKKCTDIPIAEILIADVKAIEWNKVEEKWESTVWDFVDILEDRFVKCGFLVGCHDYRGMHHRDREPVHGSLNLTQSTISEETAAQDVRDGKSASLDLTLSTISEGTATQYIRKDKSMTYDLFLTEDEEEPASPPYPYSSPAGTF